MSVSHVAAVLVLGIFAAFMVRLGGGASIGTQPAVAAGVSAIGAVQPPSLAEIAVQAGENGNDFYFDPNPLSVASGPLGVTFTNVGPSRQHTFNVARQDGREQLFNSETVEPGQTAVFELDLAPGSYTFYCILYGHANKGQTGELTVTP